jgi:hypothetical protein
MGKTRRTYAEVSQLFEQPLAVIAHDPRPAGVRPSSSGSRLPSRQTFISRASRRGIPTWCRCWRWGRAAPMFYR